MRNSSPRRPLDVLVIGGGVTGAGIAVDAASRGLRTGIVESEDWGSGTSSRSSKLVHGGLRYLQMLDFGLVKEALRERDLLLTTLAPHLVRSVPFLYPLRRPLVDRAYIGAGIALYDVLASVRSGALLRPRRRAVPWHRHLTRRSLRQTFPGLRSDAVRGAIRYWDASVDDARLVTALVRTAVREGASAASRTRVTGFITRGDAVVGAVVHDIETGESFEVYARSVISATGVWTEHTQSMAGDGGLQVLASKGVHLVVPRECIEGDAGLIVPTATSVLFVIPWDDHWVIGTTDTPWPLDQRHPVPTARDIDYLLDEANKVLARPVTKDDVVATWAGLRPLLQPTGAARGPSTKVSREHTVITPRPGFVSIAGGKLTTYRVMAADAVDVALGETAAHRPSVTNRLPLVGAGDRRIAAREAREMVRRHELPREMVDHLVRRYGVEVVQIAALCEGNARLARPLEHAPAYLGAEIVFAIRFEAALHLADLLERRTRIAFEYAEQGAGAAAEVASIAREELGWDDDRERLEIDVYRESVRAHLEAALQTDDASAAAVRAAARDLPAARI